MLGLESHNRVTRFGPEDAVDLTAVKPFLGKTVLRGCDAGVCGLPALVVLVAILAAIRAGIVV